MTNHLPFADEHALVAPDHGRRLVEAAASLAGERPEAIESDDVDDLVRYCVRGGLTISTANAAIMLEQQRLSMIGESHD